MKEKAQSLINKLQMLITTKGAYENAGVAERIKFSDCISRTKLTWQDQSALMRFLQHGIDNIDYSNQPSK